MEDLDTLLNSVAVALVLLDGGARIIFANKAFGALTEVDPEALAGRHRTQRARCGSATGLL